MHHSCGIHFCSHWDDDKAGTWLGDAVINATLTKLGVSARKSARDGKGQSIS